jgi:hypothetical protein
VDKSEGNAGVRPSTSGAASPVSSRYVWVLLNAAASFLYFLAYVGLLFVPWRINRFYQWRQGAVANAAGTLMCRAARMTLGAMK